MAEPTGDAQPRDVIVRVHGRLDADDGIQLEQRHRRRRTLEIDPVENSRRQRIRVHLEADLECRPCPCQSEASRYRNRFSSLRERHMD